MRTNGFLWGEELFKKKKCVALSSRLLSLTSRLLVTSTCGLLTLEATRGVQSKHLVRHDLIGKTFVVSSCQIK